MLLELILIAGMAYLAYCQLKIVRKLEKMAEKPKYWQRRP